MVGKKMFLKEFFLGEGILGSLVEGNLPPLTMFSQTTDAKVPAASPGIILNAARAWKKEF